MRSPAKFAVDVGITFVASSISMFLGLVLGIILGRYLGAEELGWYRIVSTLFGMVMVVGTMGIPAAMIKYVAEVKEDRNELGRIASSGIVTSAIFGSILSFAFFLSSASLAGIFRMDDLTGLLRLLSPVFPVALVGGAQFGILNGLRQMKQYAMGIVIQSATMLLVSLVSIYFGYGISGVVVGITLSSLASMLYLTRVEMRIFTVSISKYVESTIKTLRFGWKIVATNSVNQITYQADVIIIGVILTAEDVGYYAVAVWLCRLLWMIPSAIQTISYPTSSELWSKRRVLDLGRMIDGSMRYTACILYPAGLILGLFAGDLIMIILGSSFIPSAAPVTILVTGAIVWGILTSVGGTLQGIGKPEIALRIGIAIALLNVTLNTILIPITGVSGAAYASTITNVAGTLLILLSIRRFSGISIDMKWHVKLASFFVILLIIGLWLQDLGFLYRATLVLVMIVGILGVFISKEERVALLRLIRSIREIARKRIVRRN